mgnify:CR=1 FL=1
MNEPYRFWLNEFELLRAVNVVSRQRGGCHVGHVGRVYWRPGKVSVGATFRNQWLISAELVDVARWTEITIPQWEIRLGFCQTSISRAPRGGFEVTVEPFPLSLCRTVDDAVAVVDCIFGKADARQDAADELWQRLTMEAAAIPVPLWRLTSIVREDALAYAQENRTI